MGLIWYMERVDIVRPSSDWSLAINYCIRVGNFFLGEEYLRGRSLLKGWTTKKSEKESPHSDKTSDFEYGLIIPAPTIHTRNEMRNIWIQMLYCLRCSNGLVGTTDETLKEVTWTTHGGKDLICPSLLFSFPITTLSEICSLTLVIWVNARLIAHAIF